MFGIHDFLLFLCTGILLNITPGPDLLYISSRSASQGLTAGFVATAGIISGCFVHVISATLGLSAILATSAMAFTVVKLIGACYLIYVGASMLWSSWFSRSAREHNNEQQQFTAPVRSAVSYRKIFRQGFLTDVLNPKVALFFLAFLPQFVDQSVENSSMGFFLLGVTFVVTGLIVNMGMAWVTARVSSALKCSKRVSNWFNRCTGTLFVFLGIRLALADR